MLKITLALIGLSLSLSSNAAVITHGDLLTDDTTDVITDTDTGRQYKRFDTFDLTYAQTVTSVGAGGAYEGWSIATADVADGFIAAALKPGASGCAGAAVTYCGSISTWADGNFGASRTSSSDDYAYQNGSLGFDIIGLVTIRSFDGYTTKQHEWSTISTLDSYSGLYPINLLLYKDVAEVPLPAAGWLFISALVGLVGKKRLFR